MSARKVIDWEAVEFHYRSGIRSLKDMGKEYGVSDAGILKKAKVLGWTRDLAAKIKSKADAKVSAAAVSAEVSVAKAANEVAVVEANAELQYRVRMEHRQDIGRTRKLFQALLSEVEAASTTEGQGLIAQLFALLNDEPDPDSADADRKRYDAMRRRLDLVLSTSGRIDSAKKLTEMLERLVKMEREAFGIQAESDQGNTGIDALLAKMRGIE